MQPRPDAASLPEAAAAEAGPLPFFVLRFFLPAIVACGTMDPSTRTGSWIFPKAKRGVIHTRVSNCAVQGGALAKLNCAVQPCSSKLVARRGAVAQMVHASGPPQLGAATWRCLWSCAPQQRLCQTGTPSGLMHTWHVESISSCCRMCAVQLAPLCLMRASGLAGRP